jgi:protein-S-isoprenylcysteine O-methyltransferase Ste14
MGTAGRTARLVSGMGRRIAGIGLGFLALAALAGLGGWLFFGAATPTPAGWSLGPVWLYVAGVVFLVGVIAAFFMWLTFYSADHGFDDRAGKDEP